MPEAWNIIGHGKIVGDLRKSLTDGRVQHAYLFTGPRHLGKLTVARSLAATLMCADKGPCGECPQCRLRESGNHPDFFELHRDDKIGIADVRKLKAKLTLKPHSASYRVGIIPDLPRLGEPAQNALLKLLEEPPGHTVLILTAVSPESLLPTTVSRCSRISFGLVGDHDIAQVLGESCSPELLQAAGGRPGLATSLAGNPEALQSRLRWQEMLEDTVAAIPSKRVATAKVLADSEELPDILDHWISLHRLALHAEIGVTPEPPDNITRLARQFSEAQLSGNLRTLVAARRSLRYNPNVLLRIENTLLKLGE